jgi:WD40 repeat protein
MIRDVVFSADGKRLAFGLSARTTSVFDVMSGDELHVLESRDGSGFGIEMAVSPDGTRVVTRAREQLAAANPAGARVLEALRNERQIIRVREVATGAELFQVAFPQWALGPIAFSADGRRIGIASRASERKIRVLNASTGAIVAEFDAPRAFPHALAFSPDDQRLACGLVDGTALIWDLSEIPAPTP